MLADLYPGSEHVRNCGLSQANDSEVLDFAKQGEISLVTKDERFPITRASSEVIHQEVLWIRSGNCATDLIETPLRKNFDDVQAFEADANVGFLGLY